MAETLVTSRRSLRPPTAPEAVFAELRRAIKAGELKPAAVLNQDELAREFGLSRVPVREALKILEGEGLVSYTPHIGFTVTSLTFTEVEEIYQLRALLETEAVRRGMPNITDSDVERMRDLLANAIAAEEKGDVLKLSIANRELHFAMVEPCHRPRLLRVLGSLYDSTEPYRPVYFMPSEDRPHIHTDHEEIIEAFQARDRKKVIARMNSHRDRLVRALRNGMSNRS